MGNQPLKVINCSGKKIWYKIDANRQMLIAAENTTSFSLAEIATVSQTQRFEFENQFAQNGWSVLNVGAWEEAHNPDGQHHQALFISAIDSTGTRYCTGKPWNEINGHYPNVVFGDDGGTHMGYKNKKFRCKGSPNFFGGHKCDGCN